MEAYIDFTESTILKYHMVRYQIETGINLHQQCVILGVNGIPLDLMIGCSFTGYNSVKSVLHRLFEITGKMEAADYWGPHKNHETLEELRPGSWMNPWFVLDWGEAFGITKHVHYECPKCGNYSGNMKLMSKKYVPTEEDIKARPDFGPKMMGNGDEILGCEDCGEVWTWFQLKEIEEDEQDILR